MFKKKVLVILGSIVFIAVILYISKDKVYNRQYQDNLSITIEELKNKQVTPWGVKLIGQTSKNERIIKVAILDSGVDKEHPDLNGKIIKEFNATNLPDTDKLGHGTAVAGILTANDNDIGIVGVRKNIEIYSAKVIRDNGKVNKQDFIKGFEWAILNDVDIINISLGFSKEFPEWAAYVIATHAKKDKKYCHFAATVEDGGVYIGKGLSKSDAVSRLKSKKDTFSISQNQAKGVAASANRSGQPIHEVDKKGGKPRKGYYYHYHPAKRSPNVHAFYGTPVK